MAPFPRAALQGISKGVRWRATLQSSEAEATEWAPCYPTGPWLGETSTSQHSSRTQALYLNLSFSALVLPLGYLSSSASGRSTYSAAVPNSLQKKRLLWLPSDPSRTLPAKQPRAEAQGGSKPPASTALAGISWAVRVWGYQAQGLLVGQPQEGAAALLMCRVAGWGDGKKMLQTQSCQWIQYSPLWNSNRRTEKGEYETSKHSFWEIK